MLRGRALGVCSAALGEQAARARAASGSVGQRRGVYVGGLTMRAAALWRGGRGGSSSRGDRECVYRVPWVRALSLVLSGSRAGELTVCEVWSTVVG